MRALVLRLVTRSLLVGLALGAMGYAFAQAYLVLVKINGGIADESVNWRVPLNMVSIGVAILVTVEVLVHFLRRKRPSVPPSLDEPNSPPPPSGAAS
jgi:hypothetical protein